MQPIEFLTEMSGVVKVLGDEEPPTLEQWKRIVTMLGETMGPIVAAKMLEESAEEKRRKIFEELGKQQRALPFGNPTYQPPFYTLPSIPVWYDNTGAVPTISVSKTWPIDKL